MKEDVHVFRCDSHWIVCNKLYKAKRENHSHFWHRKAAFTLKTLIESKVIPETAYMIESALRVSIDRHYKNVIKETYGLPENVNIYDKEISDMIEDALIKRGKYE